MNADPIPVQNLASDSASREMIEKARAENQGTCFSRVDEQRNPCKFGAEGACCRICSMGPCRITAKSPLGVCGADIDTIAARNLLRHVAAGTAAHSDHGRHLTLLLKSVAQGKTNDFRIQSRDALHHAARCYGISVTGRMDPDIALELADLFLSEFSQQETPLRTLGLATAKRQSAWNGFSLNPLGIDRMVVESLHRTHMGVDHDYKSILMQALRTALADGWGGSRIATQVSDILFGLPSPVRSRANLGVLGEKTVNVLVHGHEPALSEMLTAAAADPEVLAAAKKAGAEGITLAGICCTANEILMRHGIPVAGSFLQQELAIITGAVEMLLVDVQCCMPSLPQIAAAYHTRIVSTSNLAKTLGADARPFEKDHAYEHAKKLLLEAAQNFSRRDPSKVRIPKDAQSLIAGFSLPAVKYMLGGTYRASLRPLNDAIMQGRIAGIAAVVGCNNPRTKMDETINTLTLELIRNNVLVLQTGCAALASAKQGMLTPEAALEHAGPGLREVCETVGMPPVLHAGSCVDNSRLLEALTDMVAEGGLGDDLSSIPVVGAAPEWMSEKAIAIGCYFVASGVDVVLGKAFPVLGSQKVTDFLHKDAAGLLGASFHTAENGLEAATRMLDIIQKRRERLGIHKKSERKMMDMADRRRMHV